MGGYGSGRWNAHSKKITVEECIKFTLADITRMHGQPLPELVGVSGGIWWTNGSSIGYTIRHIDNQLQLFLGYSVNGKSRMQPIRISETECNYGGLRYWMHCPRCHKRGVKLYILWGKVACRQCYDLTYTSVQEAHRFDSVRRFLGSGFKLLDSHYEAAALIEKWNERKRLTKGERKKIARALGLPVFMVRSRWYRRKTRAKRELEARAMAKQQ
jgi:hypothetical protein